MATSTVGFVLPIYDVGTIQRRMEAKERSSASVVSVAMTAASFILGPILDPPDKQQNNLSHMCASGLTAREVANRLASIPNDGLRKKLAATVLPYIMSKSNENMQKLFDDLDFNFNELDDTKGDINVNEQTYQDSSERRKINIYYAK
jgi:hypothetical protein